MKKYKVCPNCHTKNDPNSFECKNHDCEWDLTGVRVTDDESEIKILKANSCDESEPQTVRVCEECGTKNPSNVRKCMKCGNDISDPDTLPSVGSAVSTKAKPHTVLKSVDGILSFEITKDTIIGKEQSMAEYLSAKGYVSRTHAKLIIDEDGLCIENLSKTNPTFINNVEIVEKTRLHNGDEIGLGGNAIDGKRQEKAAYFIVSII